MESKVLYTSETIKRLSMINLDKITFNPIEDLNNLNSIDNNEKYLSLLKVYSEELNYWKIKHNKLQKKIQDIVCS